MTPPSILSYGPLLWKAFGTSSAAVPPIFIARAGLDGPGINEPLDRFLAEAMAKNLSIEMMNHPDGHHSFDLLDADARSREIIQRALEFIRARLERN